MKNLVVSLELAKQLKEAGFPQRNCTFYHYFNAGKPTGAIVTGDMYRDVDDDFLNNKLLALPLAEEILERLPEIISTDPNELVGTVKGYLTIQKLGYYEVGYTLVSGEMLFESVEAKESLAEAAGKMYIYLKKEGLLK